MNPFNWLIDFIFPKLCLGCQAQGQLLCSKCRPKIQYVFEQGCPICYQPSIAGLRHPNCGSKNSLDGLWSIAYFRGPIKTLIHQLKYHQATIVTQIIPEIIQEYQQYETIHLPTGGLIPVPLHPKSLRIRGFNQSQIIAQHFSQATNLPVLEDLVHRTIWKKSQTQLNRTQRQQNVQGVFSLNPHPDTLKLTTDRTFILIDDVFTSGATLSELAKILKQSGAHQVYALTLARE